MLRWLSPSPGGFFARSEATTVRSIAFFYFLRIDDRVLTSAMLADTMPFYFRVALDSH